MSNPILDKVLAELDGVTGKALKKHMGFARPDDEEAAEGEAPGSVDSPEEEKAEDDGSASSILDGLDEETKQKLIEALSKE